jgi:hypothetical protein
MELDKWQIVITYDMGVADAGKTHNSDYKKTIFKYEVIADIKKYIKSYKSRKRRASWLAFPDFLLSNER